MNHTPEQVINGLISYADNEIMNKLPTSGKWIMGTAIGLASNKVSNVVDSLVNNSIVKMMGIVDDDGRIDTEALIEAMKMSADKYGKITFDVPMVGKLTFSSADIDSLRTYIR